MYIDIEKAGLGDFFRDLEHDRLEKGIAAKEPRIYVGGRRYKAWWQSKNKRRRFVFSTRPDTNGDYWVADFKLKERTKTHETWTLAGDWVRCAKRRTAKAKAWARYQRYENRAKLKGVDSRPDGRNVVK